MCLMSSGWWVLMKMEMEDGLLSMDESARCTCLDETIGSDSNGL